MFTNPLSQLDPITLALIAVFAIYTITLKGLALYRAGSRKDKKWFVAILLLNTLGILEIIYLATAKKQPDYNI